ncbi:MAG: ABC transporter family substrate-binding protein [Pseudonocardiaceae bacterium]
MRTRPSGMILSALIALVLLMLMAGCGGAGGIGSRGSDLSSTTNDINPAARDRIADTGTMSWPLSRLPPNYNYYQLNGQDIENAAVVGGLLPGTFAFSANSQPILRKEYFESAELTSAEPKQVVTYRINPKAIWYGGTPITVADFQAQWKALNGSNPAFRIASVQGYDKIENVAAGRDEREVVVTFKTHYADWRALFSVIYPASTNADPNIFNDGWRQQPLTTAGPFKLQNLDQTAQTITLVRNERWWGRPAKLERIIYRVIDPEAQVDALANGEIDFIAVGSDLNRFQRAQAIPGVTVRRAGAADYAQLTLNSRSEVLNDLRVRRALALGIDRQRIAQAQIAPLGVASTPLGNHILLTNQNGYQDNSGDLGNYDPQRAGKLLDEAGWTSSSIGRTKNGTQLILRYVVPAQITQHEQTAELVQGMLSKIGVKVTIEAVPGKDFFTNFIAPGNFDITEFVWLGSPFPISSSKPVYANPKPGPDGRLDIQRNVARVGSDEIDQLFDQATTELDPAQTVRLANDIDGKIWQEVHSLPLFQRPDIVASNSNLANFGAFGFASKSYEDIGYLVKPQS